MKIEDRMAKYLDEGLAAAGAMARKMATKAAATATKVVKKHPVEVGAAVGAGYGAAVVSTAKKAQNQDKIAALKKQNLELRASMNGKDEKAKEAIKQHISRNNARIDQLRG